MRCREGGVDERDREACLGGWVDRNGHCFVCFVVIRDTRVIPVYYTRRLDLIRSPFSGIRDADATGRRMGVMHRIMPLFMRTADVYAVMPM